MRSRRFALAIVPLLAVLIGSNGLVLQPNNPASGTQRAIASSPPPKIAAPDFSKLKVYEVVSVVDYNTVSLRPIAADKPEDQKELTARLIGVDAPDAKEQGRSAQELGTSATDFLSNLLTGERVWLEPGDGAAGQGNSVWSPAYLYRSPDGLFVNLESIRQGYARVQAEKAFKYLDAFRSYEARAKESKKGLWGTGARPASSGQPATSPTAPGSAPNKGDESKKPDTQKVTVYATRTGTKYHSAGCSYLKSSIPMTLEDAKAKGLTPCSRCHPPQ